MGKRNRKKVRPKYKRYAIRSEAALNGGITEKGKPVSPPPLPRTQVQRSLDREMQNECRRAIIREQWKGQRHQGVLDYNFVVYKEIKMYYRLCLHFSGHIWHWVFEDWRTMKRKISVVYGSKERAEEILNLDPNGMSRIVWKIEVDLDGGQVR